MTGDCVIISRLLQPDGRPTVLIVCFRFIGDVLVTTPLVSSLKRAVPGAEIDYLVFEGTEGVVACNPLVRNVITVPRKGRNAAVLASLFRSYDLAFAAYPSDRTLLASAIAGRYSVGLMYAGEDKWWKRALLSAYRYCDDREHVVSNILGMLAPLGIDPVPEVAMGRSVAPGNDRTVDGVPATGYVLLHPYSRNRCKYWPAECWGRLAGIINERTRFKAVFTVTPDPADSLYLQQILAEAPPDVIALKESCPLGQLAAVVAGSAAFVGIDTVVTHMAAALDVPLIALYGPSLSRYWAPWPNGCTEISPFSKNKGVQRAGAVTVVQQDWPCVPCNRETCSISTRGKMECLEQLTPEEVFRELKTTLASG